MSSSGRYQSKLFNFLQAGSRKLATRLEKAGQQFRWIAQTSGHYLLIPVYAVYQATRLVGKQLSGQGNPSESPGKTLGTAESDAATGEPNTASATPTGDRAIARVLSGVAVVAVSPATPDAEESWQVAVTEEDNNPLPQGKGIPALPAKRMALSDRVLNWIPRKILTRFGVNRDRPGTLVSVAATPGSVTVATATAAIATSRPVIQGIATLLETRTLVLISDRNQILDILTPVQQQQLQGRIDAELSAAEGNRSPQPLRSTATDAVLSGSQSQKQLPPVRRLRHRLGGVQRPVAHLFDRSLGKVGELLQPSSLVLQPDGIRELPEPEGTASANNPPKLASAFLVMDAAVARLEGMHLPQGGTLSQTVTNTGESILQGIQNLAVALVTEPPPDSLSEKPGEEQPPSLRMQRLIQAAVDYFFGPSEQGLPGQGDRALTVAETANPQLSSPSEFQEENLLQNSANVKPLPMKSAATTGQLPSHPDLDRLPDSFWGVEAVEQFVKPQRPTRTGRTHRASASSKRKSGKGDRRARVRYQSTAIEKPVIETPAVTVEPTRRVSQNPPAVATSVQLPPQVERQPKTDWIDVEIADVEYIMHPLEQALKWFDLLLVWLEEKLIQGWQWARQQLFS